jgi:hypothetical protein
VFESPFFSLYFFLPPGYVRVDSPTAFGLWARLLCVFVFELIENGLQNHSPRRRVMVLIGDLLGQQGYEFSHFGIVEINGHQRSL